LALKNDVFLWNQLLWSMFLINKQNVIKITNSVSRFKGENIFLKS
jgi:hypothetical protein